MCELRHTSAIVQKMQHGKANACVSGDNVNHIN
jgi:hypothetical protein